MSFFERLLARLRYNQVLVYLYFSILSGLIQGSEGGNRLKRRKESGFAASRKEAGLPGRTFCP